ncbi:TPA: tRNA lysidine(34) synthetase TilS [Streptococcus suis]|nr:tRNA lysidine(34) synthetase TilS [Streptococcus suis]
MMKEKFLKVTQAGHFFDKHDRVLIAVSGGKDSMNLLNCLYIYKSKLKINLGIAHVNHKQRLESDEEEIYLKKWANQHNIPFYSRNFVGKFSEKAARDFRYHFFAEIMEKEGFSALVTAHHADDQAETIFMRMLRGTRLIHLGAMQPVQDFASGQLIRPFLSLKKEELDTLFHFEDMSNSFDIYLRNRVRHHYIPQLEEENPKFSQALIDLGQESSLLYQAFKDLTADFDVTDLSVFHQLSPAVQYFSLQKYLENFPDLQLTKPHFEEILAILRNKANYYHPLKNGYLLQKDYRTFNIKKISPQTDSKLQSYVIESEGIFHFLDYTLSINQVLENPDQVIYLEEKFPVIIRGRRPADRILVNGIDKKVSRYFIDQKIPQFLRDITPLVEQNGKIYGIFNIIASDLSKSLKHDIMKFTLYIKRKK